MSSEEPFSPMSGLSIRSSPVATALSSEEDLYPPSGNVPVNEIHTNVTKKSANGLNAYASKLFLLQKKGAAKPYGIRKFTTLANPMHSYTVSKTKREGIMYKLIQAKVPGYRDYVMPFLRAASEGPWSYVDFEFVEGKDLVDLLAEEPTVLRKRALVADIAEALGALLNAGITHGDVKADNVFVRAADGRALLLDFADAHRDSKPTDIQRDLDAFLALAASVGVSLPPVTMEAEAFYWKVVDELRGGKRARPWSGGKRSPASSKRSAARRKTRRKNRRRN
jgi:serine/threonine protein kinase